MRPRSVVLLSGGLDSATAMALSLSLGEEVHALSFRYGQRHAHELACAAELGKAAAAHAIVDLDLGMVGGSALTANLAVPQGVDPRRPGIPITYVPARNTIFIAFALAWAEVLSAENIVVGVNAVDYSGYPDCRPEYIAAFQAMADLATKAGIAGTGPRIRAPLIDMSKAEIIRLGRRLGVNFAQTSSCYEPDDGGGACRTCDACQLRRDGFNEAGVPDPTRYACIR